eukprot:12937832-Prorocentrum_lima.AAC.1
MQRLFFWTTQVISADRRPPRPDMLMIQESVAIRSIGRVHSMIATSRHKLERLVTEASKPQ